MENIINKIIEIDRLAEERLHQAETKQNEISLQAQNECKKLEEKLRHDADARISEIEKINKREFEILSEDIAKKYDEKLKNMDLFYEKNHIDIENKIFGEIVGEVS